MPCAVPAFVLCFVMCFVLCLGLALPGVARGASMPDPSVPMNLRTAYGVNEFAGFGPSFLTDLKIIETFQQHHPNIRPVSSQGLQLVGAQQEMIPLMQIAGDIAPDVLQVPFARSDTYIRNRFLYPLDKYLEGSLNINVRDGHLLSTDDYIAALKKSPQYEQDLLDDRIPRTVWTVMRRECPYGEKCPYVAQWNGKPAAHHQHVWAFPQSVYITALFYRKELFAEAGLPTERPPADLDELYDWAKKLTNPRENRYGLAFNAESSDPATMQLGSGTLSFLYAYGGRLVEQDAQGNWRCTFDSEAAVNAYYFLARLFCEPFDNKYGHFDSVIVEPKRGASLKVAMYFSQLNDRFFGGYDPSLTGFGPVPAGPGGTHAADLGAVMTGIFGGLDTDTTRRDAAWKYIYFYDSPEARLIRAKIYVENGAGQFLSSKLLRTAGYPEFIPLIPKGWEEAQHEAAESGIPQPYGKNCQSVYQYVSQAIDQINHDSTVIAAMQRHDETTAKNRIRQILHERVAAANERMLGLITPQQRQMRNTVATLVAIAIFLAFVFVFYRVFKAFTQIPAVGDMPPAGESSPEPASSMWPHRLFLRWLGFGGRPALHTPNRGHWQFIRYRRAYFILLPALGSIALWAYYPLARGTTIAFQDYNVRGFSTWVGIDNFANILFDPAFWNAMWVSLKYTFLHMAFGFFTPIILAFLLTEVPTGRIFYRTLYYLPAVLSGAVVMFLWKDFYSSYGLLNQLLNVFVHLFNHIPTVHLNEIHTKWLEQPSTSLFCVILPIAWAGMGPGCLIYLAALKTIPDEFYEAAEIDGAGILHKLRHVAYPGIKALIIINFIGAVIGTFHGGAENVLAMTGGGPYAPYGSSEVIGLHIFWQTFGGLRFGPGAAMAWVLGAMLIGFTVMQLTKLSKMEFRAAGPNAGTTPSAGGNA
jgi:multiple sugar transport system permease protein